MHGSLLQMGCQKSVGLISTHFFVVKPLVALQNLSRYLGRGVSAAGVLSGNCHDISAFFVRLFDAPRFLPIHLFGRRLAL